MNVDFTKIKNVDTDEEIAYDALPENSTLCIMNIADGSKTITTDTLYFVNRNDIDDLRTAAENDNVYFD